jgi:hypothetical protein
MRRRTPLQHAMDRFTADPSSVNAAAVMIIITVGIVLGGLIVWVLTRDFGSGRRPGTRSRRSPPSGTA